MKHLHSCRLTLTVVILLSCALTFAAPEKIQTFNTIDGILNVDALITNVGARSVRLREKKVHPVTNITVVIIRESFNPVAQLANASSRYISFTEMKDYFISLSVDNVYSIECYLNLNRTLGVVTIQRCSNLIDEDGRSTNENVFFGSALYSQVGLIAH